MSNILEKIQKTPRGVLYLALLLSLAVPLLRPIGLPITYETAVLDGYDTLDNLPPGSVVILNVDNGPAAWLEFKVVCSAVAHHLFSKPYKIIVFSCVTPGSAWSYGPKLFVTTLLPELEAGPIAETGKVYGEDYVIYDVLLGAEPGLAAYLADMHATNPVDYWGNRMEDLPMMENIRSAHDVTAWTGQPGYMAWYQRQIRATYGTTMVGLTQSVYVSYYYPYYQAEQLEGLIGGITQAAQYERLTDRLGAGTKKTDATSMAHIVFIIFVLLSNITYWGTRRGGG